MRYRIGATYLSRCQETIGNSKSPISFTSKGRLGRERKLLYAPRVFSEFRGLRGLYPMWTYYDNLKVARNAPPAVIKAAYRALSQQYHPDRNPAPDAERIIRLINEAYDVLGDPTRRAEYDRELESREKEEKLAAQRKAAAARKDDEAAAAHARRKSSPATPTPRPAPAPRPTPSAAAAAGSALPPVWVRVLLCAVLFAIGVWFSWREELDSTASHDAVEVADTTAPWVTPSRDSPPEVAAPASSTSVPTVIQPAIDPASVPAAANPTPTPPAGNPAPALPPVRWPTPPVQIRPALPAPTPPNPDADFTATLRKQVPDLDRIIHDPDWKTYAQWHEGTTTIGQIAKGAFIHRDLKTLVKIFDTFRLAKNTAVSRGMSFPQLMEYEEQLIKTLPAHSGQ